MGERSRKTLEKKEKQTDDAIIKATYTNLTSQAYKLTTPT